MRDPVANRTYHYWHVFLPGVKSGQIYGYRVHGRWDPATGMRFDPTKVLLDPYGRAVVVPKDYDRNIPELAMKSVVVDSHDYDWEALGAKRHEGELETPIRFAVGQRWVRGLFSGGTLALETLSYLAAVLSPVSAHSAGRSS